MAFEVLGKLKRAFIDPATGKTNITLEINDRVEAEALNFLGRCGQLRINLTKYSKRRSKDANSLLWACIGDIARETGSKKEEIYHQLLKDWGVSDFVVIRRTALARFMACMGGSIKFCEKLDLVPVGKKHEEGVQLQIFYGSSTYSVEQFQRLLEGCFEEMRNVGIQPPPQTDLIDYIEQMRKEREREKKGYY